MNQKSLQELISQYSDMLLRISFTYVKNTYDAEDILQTVFLRCYEKDIAFHDEEHKKAWLIRSVINESKSLLRSSWHKKRISLEENLSYIDEEKLGVIEEVLKLPEKYRNVIVLHYVEGYSINEIAQILKKNSSTIGTHLERARKKLKLNLEEEGENAKGKVELRISRN